MEVIDFDKNSIAGFTGMDSTASRLTNTAYRCKMFKIKSY
jgi:hypothetical protein